MAIGPLEEPRAASKSEVAYRWIRERIADGRFTPGYRLVLGNIAKQIDVSPVPVREAVRRLEAEGLVTFERNVGAHVSLVDDREYEYTMQLLEVVESAATAMAAPHIGELDVARARAINDRMTASLIDFDPHLFTSLNHEFHAALFEQCPNPHMLDLVRRGWNRLNSLRDSIFSFVPGRSNRSVVEHENILRLIESGAESLEIELAVREHRKATLGAYREFRRG